MAKYMVVIRAESKYFRYLNKHKVTNVPSGRGKGRNESLPVVFFFNLAA